MVYIIAYLTAHTGKGGEVVALTKSLIEATRSEAGCVSYELYRNLPIPTHWCSSKHGRTGQRSTRILPNRI